MGNPKKKEGVHIDNLQIDNGNYTRIHNRILEELCKITISGQEMRVILFLWRKTYGWQKKEEYISYKQIQDFLGCEKSGVSRVLKKLIQRGLVTQMDNSNNCIYSFNKHFTTWKQLPKKITVTQKENSSYPKRELATKNENKKTSKTQIDINQKPLGIKLAKYSTKETVLKESIYSLFNHWNSLKIIIHRRLDKYKPHLSSALKNYSVEEIKDAMKNYAIILKGEEYFWSYHWGLEEFLSRKNGIDKFLSCNNPFENFRKKSQWDTKDTNPNAQIREEKDD